LPDVTSALKNIVEHLRLLCVLPTPEEKAERRALDGGIISKRFFCYAGSRFLGES
jgi:hypothetical protein